jgi:DeoR family glycerol-3-phosphate regulon repressor
LAASEQRRRAIVELVRRQGFAPIDVLAQQFAVTPQTIRRDLNQLSVAGALQRFHGGAGLPSSVENLAYPTRQVLCLEDKQRIARLAARHVPDNASLFINIGTTTEEVAKALLQHHGLSVITNNLNVASILAGKPDFRVIVAGGVVRSRDRGLVGEATLDLIRQFKVDIGIIGISGVDLDGALLDFDYREVRVTQAIIENSRRIFLTADHTKFGRNAMVRLGSVRQIDALFTDRAPPPELAEKLREAAVAIHVAGPEDTGQAA